MKYASYIIFFAFLFGSILFLKNALEPAPLPLQIVGSKKCGECHELLKHGNQQKVWTESRHAFSYNSLLSDKAVTYAKQNSIENPVNNKLCLRCHTTKGFLQIETSESYNIDEGIGCEGCHGAGSRYLKAEIMREENLFVKNNGNKCDEETCIKCHSLKANTDRNLTEYSCPFQQVPFVFKDEFSKIEHPLNQDNFK